jgi:hypothetical protein
MEVKVTKVESFPPNSNPYLYDISRMGENRGEELHMMYSNHGDEVCDHIVLVDRRTGERVRIDITYGDDRDK